MSQIFESKLNAIGITLDEKQKQQFDKFYELLVEWNKVMNLTGITEYEEVNEKHFLDSLAFVKAVDMENPAAKDISFDGSNVVLNIPRHDYRIVLFE